MSDSTFYGNSPRRSMPGCRRCRLAGGQCPWWCTLVRSQKSGADVAQYTRSMCRSSILSFLAATCLAAFALAVESQAQSPAGPRFEVPLEVSMAPQSDGRLLVVLAPAGSPEPRRLSGRTGTGASPILGRDVRGFDPGQTVTLRLPLSLIHI